MSRLKSGLRSIVPEAARRALATFRQFMRRRENRNRTTEEVFSEIYQQNRWGGRKGEFYSGSGSEDERIVKPYVDMLLDFFEEKPRNLTFVDIGCGDFRVGRSLVPLCSRYIGLDVVRPLVERNQKEFAAPNVHFVHCDAASQGIPEGDACFVRQVLQHLSNDQIVRVLGRLGVYRWVFITEHYPADDVAVVPNRDKVQGEDIRLFENSGVYLEEPPFSIPRRALTLMLEVPGGSGDSAAQGGIIRTFLYEPSKL